MIPIEQLREQGQKPVRITAKGEIFIGDDEFPYPVQQGSISVSRQGRSINVLTLSLFVGDVAMETRKPKPDPDAPMSADDAGYVQSSNWGINESVPGLDTP